MELFLTKLFFLMFGHALMDYSLQTDFIAKGKNRHTAIPGMPWYYVMSAHCMLHAGMVVMFTGSMTFGIVEFITHFILDCLKCEGAINTHVDQAGHVTYKVVYVALS